jgi:uncharacterized protein
MNRIARVFLNAGRIRPGWRFAIFLALYLAGEKAFDFLLPKIFPNFVFGMTWQSMLPNEALDFAFVAAVAWLMSRIERERFSAYGLPLFRGAGRLFMKGVVWGIIPSILILVPLYFAGACSFHGLALRGSDLAISALGWALAFIGVGFAEEFLFRGYSLKTLAEGIGFWPAAVALSSLFGLVHLVFKPNEGWIDPISVSLYGLFWCLTLRRTGSLWYAVGFHAASDYTDMVVFAEPNTGNEGKPLPGHLLDVQFHGPAWLTGGPRGTEASLLVFVVLAGLFYLFHRAYPERAQDSSSAAAGEMVRS